MRPNQINGKAAVLLVDMQPYFVEHLKMWTRIRLVHSQIQLIRYCAEVDVPLVVLEYGGKGSTIRELLLEISRVPRKTFVTKGTPDGFENPELNGDLQYLDIETLVLTGINASTCVLETAQSAITLGYSIVTTGRLIANVKRQVRYISHEFTQEFRQGHRTWYEANGTYHNHGVDPKHLLPRPLHIR